MDKSLKEKIFDLYSKGLSYSRISEILKCSRGTISYHLHVFKSKEKEERLNWIEEVKKQKFDSKIIFLEKFGKLLTKREFNKISRELFHKKSSKFKSNTPEYYKNRRNEIKESLIDYKGGKCEVCNYDKCKRALHFHHITPSKKDFTISQNLKSLSIDKVKKEIDKCILVCANCHAEIHESMEQLVVEAG